MTLEVGILCKDGVIIAADSATTFAPTPNVRIMEQQTRKIALPANKMIVAGTGAVGLAQRFEAIVENAQKNAGFNALSVIEKGKHLCQQAINDFRSTGLQQMNFGALVAFAHEGKPHLVEFDQVLFQPEQKDEKIWYVSIGSGEMIADPMLAFMREVFWQDGPPTLQNGIFAAMWVMYHAVNINAGGVNGPIHIAILEKVGDEFNSRLLEDEELDEHKQNVTEMIKYMRGFKTQSQKAAAADLPAPPAPEAISAPVQMEVPAPPHVEVNRAGN